MTNRHLETPVPPLPVSLDSWTPRIMVALTNKLPQGSSHLGFQGPRGQVTQDPRDPGIKSCGIPGIQGPHAANLLFEACCLDFIDPIGPWSGLGFHRSGFHGSWLSIRRDQVGHPVTCHPMVGESPRLPWVLETKLLAPG